MELRLELTKEQNSDEYNLEFTGNPTDLITGLIVCMENDDTFKKIMLTTVEAFNAVEDDNN